MLVFKRTPCLLLFGWLAFVVAPAWGANPLVDDILVKSGAIDQLAQISRIAQLSYEKADAEREGADAGQPPALRDRIRKLIGEAFAPDKLKESIGAELEAKLTPAEMQAIIKWLDSPLIKKCTQLEIAAATPEASEEIDAYMVELQRKPAPKSRSQLAKQFDATQHATRSTATVILGMQIASISAITAMLPSEKQISFSELVKVAEKQRPALEVSMRPMVRAQILYTYRSLSTAELKQYIKEMGTGPGKKFYSVSQSAYEKALIEASARSSKSILETVRNLDKETDA
ncbi:MAG: hypothetical protein AB9873_17320 [Syntrophobacteraceae bacterium]